MRRKLPGSCRYCRLPVVGGRYCAYHRLWVRRKYWYNQWNEKLEDEYQAATVKWQKDIAEEEAREKADLLELVGMEVDQLVL